MLLARVTWLWKSPPLPVPCMVLSGGACGARGRFVDLWPAWFPSCANFLLVRLTAYPLFCLPAGLSAQTNPAFMELPALALTTYLLQGGPGQDGAPGVVPTFPALTLVCTLLLPPPGSPGSEYPAGRNEAAWQFSCPKVVRKQ